MSYEEANEIAAEQISCWKDAGIAAEEAWRALGLQMAWAVEWYEVKAAMIRWLVKTRNS